MFQYNTNGKEKDNTIKKNPLPPPPPPLPSFPENRQQQQQKKLAPAA